MQSAYRNIEITPSSFFPPPHSGILFLLVFHVYYADYRRSGFRPLIQGFFFILKGCRYDKEPVDGGFPSPYSGILFLYPEKTLFSPLHNWGFPSPHSGILFLFLINAAALMFNGNGGVSVPSFGDSFFITYSTRT